jgi:hypothetical protein
LMNEPHTFWPTNRTGSGWICGELSTSIINRMAVNLGEGQ